MIKDFISVNVEGIQEALLKRLLLRLWAITYKLQRPRKNTLSIMTVKNCADWLTSLHVPCGAWKAKD